jgi:hypothetical protein
MFSRQFPGGGGLNSSHRTLIRKRGFIVLPFDKSSDVSDYNMNVPGDGRPHRTNGSHSSASTAAVLNEHIRNHDAPGFNDSGVISNVISNSSSILDMSKMLFDRPLKILSLSKKDDARQAKRENAMKISMALHQYHLAKK